MKWIATLSLCKCWSKPSTQHFAVCLNNSYLGQRTLTHLCRPGLKVTSIGTQPAQPQACISPVDAEHRFEALLSFAKSVHHHRLSECGWKSVSMNVAQFNRREIELNLFSAGAFELWNGNLLELLSSTKKKKFLLTHSVSKLVPAEIFSP